MCAIPERLRGAFTTRRYTNPRLPLPYLTLLLLLLLLLQLCGHWSSSMEQLSSAPVLRIRFLAGSRIWAFNWYQNW